MKSKMITVALFVLAASVLPAAADMVLTVTATQGGLTASQQYLVTCGGATTTWSLPSSVALTSPHGASLGVLKQLDVSTNVDPFVNLHFSVENDTALPVTYDVSSSVVSFPTILNPDAYATAGITLTSDFNGATVAGLFPGGKVYEARYNTSAVYANLVNGLTILDNTTVTTTDRLPPLGTQTIFDSVSSIQSEFDFTLSDGDQASGTSRFEVTAPTPEPTTISLLVMGGMAVLARRKRTTKLN
jgi:hypothetical protein